MTAVIYRRYRRTTLSTDHPKTSSASQPIFALACCVVFALVTDSSLLAQRLDGARAMQSPSQTVGERLAADLTWTQAERDHRFAHMDEVFPVHAVRRGSAVRRMPPGQLLLLPPDAVSHYMRTEHLGGVLVLQRGRVQVEQYALALTPSTRWTSFSMTKAMTDTLAGVALRSGALRSLDEGVTRYLPEMRGSAYEGVTVRQLMTMTSGVRWNENYTSPDADNVRLYTTPVAPGRNGTVEYMRTLPRAAAPGLRWAYNTGETDLLGVLLRRATGKSALAAAFRRGLAACRHGAQRDVDRYRCRQRGRGVWRIGSLGNAAGLWPVRAVGSRGRTRRGGARLVRGGHAPAGAGRRRGIRLRLVAPDFGRHRQTGRQLRRARHLRPIDPDRPATAAGGRHTRRLGRRNGSGSHGRTRSVLAAGKGLPSIGRAQRPRGE